MASLAESVDQHVQKVHDLDINHLRSFIKILSKSRPIYFRQMTRDDEIGFYRQEKLKFNELLNTLGWTEDYLLKEQETLIQCPFDRNHCFPTGSKHVQNCQLVKEGFSKDYLKELAECEQEKQLLHQSGISFTPSTLSHILQRPVAITTNIPLNIEQTTILFTPHERSLIAQAAHNEALQLGIVPSTLPSITDHHSLQSQNSTLSQQLNQLAELRDQKRRRTKYVTQTVKRSFYDIAREMINTKMELIQQRNVAEIPHDKHRKKHKHRSSRSDSRKHHRHSKKRQKN